MSAAAATPLVTDPLFFWGHDPTKNGMDACFSNWYPSQFKDKNGQVFSDTEMWMMYHKALLFKDNHIAQQILKCTKNPKKAKALGRKVKNFDSVIWNANCERIVYEGLLLKFEQNADLKKHLLSTHDRLLVEASPFDKIWGIGISAEIAKSTPQKLWPGKNLLGKCLVKAREQIREDFTGHRTFAETMEANKGH